MRRPDWTAAFVLTVSLPATAAAQRQISGASGNQLALERLQVTGSVLMIAAHPDDENTALMAYFARGRKVRTAYLSLTRGEGGQNLIGPEQGELLGVIRTQELLAARQIDGAEQYFTRATDFGYSKTAEETMEKWGREQTLGDIVWVIRRFRPDVVILRFSGTNRDGHGHHQASAILGKEAFAAAADPQRFPGQLRLVKPWQARRLLFNTFSFTPDQERAADKLAGRIAIDTGEYDPLLGFSYGEIAGMSRSLHRSQGFGAAERRGPLRNYLVHVAGQPASQDVFDGIDITWNRVPGGMPVKAALHEAALAYDPHRPERSVPGLMKAHALIREIDDPIARRKLKEVEEAIALCAGLWLDVSADRYAASPGETVKLEVTALNRSHLPLKLLAAEAGGVLTPPAELAYNQPFRHTLEWKVPAGTPYTQPYWLGEAPLELQGLAEGPPALEARFRFEILGERVDLIRPVLRRYVERVAGEQTRPFLIVPPVTLSLFEAAIVFADEKPRRIPVRVRASSEAAAGQVRLEIPDGWKVTPPQQSFTLRQTGEEATLTFLVTPPAQAARTELRAVAQVGGVAVSHSSAAIQYPHIPPQVVFAPARASLVRVPLATLARRVGYVMGAGDEVPAALRQMGCQVSLLDEEELANGDLSRFDAIVTGVRAYNVRADLRAQQQRLLDYVEGGGTLVVQYNVLETGGLLAGNPRALDRIGPYPLRVGRGRVATEEAPVRLLDPSHPLLSAPNRITQSDFEGWIQERGLYFASEWDKRYQPLFSSNDPGEPPLDGGTLYTRYGKGAFVFTAYSWFRQLPAGVPGAYRIFANLLSAGRLQP